MRRKLPIEAYDGRYLLLWLKAARGAILIGEVDPGVPGWELLSRRLTKFNLDMNEVRVRAKELAHPGWEDLYRASMKIATFRGKIIRLECGPRNDDLEDLLSAACGGILPPKNAAFGGTLPEVLAIPDDILDGLFETDFPPPDNPPDELAETISPDGKENT